jgi:hypothetical protein
MEKNGCKEGIGLDDREDLLRKRRHSKWRLSHREDAMNAELSHHKVPRVGCKLQCDRNVH